MRIPILNGVYTDNDNDFRVSYPVNLIPVPGNNGIAEGYVRPADGIVAEATGPGIDRGGIEWNGAVYRVMGSKLVRINSENVVTIIGDVGNVADTDLVTMAYSFDRLAVWAANKLYYYDGTTLTQVTDPDLGSVTTGVWVDGYFMSTDGQFIVVTELADPYSVLPTKYGSSDIDPDPIKLLLKLRNEVYAVNRYTCEVFDNVGGAGFPFAPITGAQVQRGAIGQKTACVMSDRIAFLGSGRNEAPGIFLAANATTEKISTREIDLLLLSYTESQLSNVLVESRIDKNHSFLYVHLPDRTIVFDANASKATGEIVWFTLTSTLVPQEYARYRARNFIWAFNRWNCSDPLTNTLGYLTESLSSHYGQIVRWEIGTKIIYNEGNGAVINGLELVALTGRSPNTAQTPADGPIITTAYSVDGVTWSQDFGVNIGRLGDRQKRVKWFKQGHMRNWRIQRFCGTSQAFMSITAIQAEVEPLAW